MFIPAAGPIATTNPPRLVWRHFQPPYAYTYPKKVLKHRTGSVSRLTFTNDNGAWPLQLNEQQPAGDSHWLKNPKTNNMNKYLFLCLLPLMACNKDNDDEANNEKSLWPLAVGNYWVYDDITYNRDGTIYEKEENYITRVAAKGSRSGYFKLEGDDEEEFYSSATELKSYNTVIRKDSLEYRYSGKQDTFNISNDDHFRTYSISFPETYTVLGYSCYKQEDHFYDIVSGPSYGHFNSKDVYYYAPGVGLVRYEYQAKDGGELWVQYQHNLVDYDVSH